MNDTINRQETILILGGDGYLGWSLGLALAHRTDKQIVLADSLIKREWEKTVNAKLLVRLGTPEGRIREYQRTFGKQNLSFYKIDLMNQKAVVRLLKQYRPTVIINAAQQPSAPYSMMSPKGAADTFSNNILGHLNVLWSIAQVDKSIRYIKLGSAGCYMDTDTTFVPLEKKNFTFTHGGETHTINNSFMPMQATDFYHQSKISDFLIDDLCASVWKLRVMTVQQSTIFGATIEENHAPERVKLSARFNYDAVFSTVINRFVCQLAIGHPLTVYGNGKQRTGVISLSDTVDNFMKFIEMDIKPGKHMVVHNYTHRMSIEEIALALQQADPRVEITYLKNPRKEPKGKLNKEVQLHPQLKHQQKNKDQKLQAEFERMIEFTRRHAHRIDQSIILPKVQWTQTESTRSRRSPLVLVKYVQYVPGVKRAYSRVTAHSKKLTA